MRRANRSVLVLLAAAALVVTPGSAGQSAGAATAVAETAAAPPARAASAAKAIVRPASLRRVKSGYYFDSWGQNNKTVVTLVDGRLKFRDPRAVRWHKLSRSCRNIRVRRGVAASCRVPRSVTPADPMTITLEMRLGDDFVDTTALGAEFEANVLADAGRDEVRTGTGDDFVNGAFDHDLIFTGDGNDWVRSGEAADTVWGEGGKDRLVGGEVGDRLHGGDGNDTIEGGPGDDTLYGDAGSDIFKCGPGNDAAEIDPADQQRSACERNV